MSRAARLLAYDGRLRPGDPTSVGALAEALGVSRRTVLRDLALLRDHGRPIVGEAGPGGGVRLDGARGVTAVHLSLAEIVALWLAAHLAREASDLPWGRAAAQALGKLLSSVPAPRARALRALAARVVVGPPASGAVLASRGQPPRDLLHLVERACESGVALRFQYVDRDGRRSLRRAEPHGLLVQPPMWYLLARDVDKEVPRMFRMDRIRRPGLLNQHPFRPDRRIIQALLPDGVPWRPLADG